MILCHLFSLFFSFFSASTLIYDLQYRTPTCYIGENQALLNSFGELTIMNNLMAKNIEFAIQLDYNQESCRLCDISSDYCSLRFGNETNLYLSQDTSYNFKLISLTSQNTTFNTLYSLNKTQKSLITNNLIPYNQEHSRRTGDDSLCGNEYRFVLFLILFIKSPIDRDIITSVKQSHHSIRCRDFNGQTDLSCQIAPQYYYVTYHVNNCLSPLSDPIQIQNKTRYSPLYWHYHRDVWPRERPSLCQEDWIHLMDRMSIQNFVCNPKLALYIKLMPWYETALEVMTAFFNNQQNGITKDLLEALDLLEMHCHQQDSNQLPLEETIFYNITLKLRNQHDLMINDGREEDCQYYNMNNTASQIALPYYVEHADGWEMKLFKLVLYFDSDMTWKSIVLLTFIILSTIITTFIIIVIIITSISSCFKKENDYRRI